MLIYVRLLLYKSCLVTFLVSFFILTVLSPPLYFFFFFNDTATTEIYTLSLHDALPICVVAQRTGGHTPGHCVVRLNSGGERLTFAGDAVFQVGFDHPDLHNGFEHDPMEAARRSGWSNPDRKSTRLNSSHT